MTILSNTNVESDRETNSNVSILVPHLNSGIHIVILVDMVVLVDIDVR